MGSSGSFGRIVGSDFLGSMISVKASSQLGFVGRGGLATISSSSVAVVGMSGSLALVVRRWVGWALEIAAEGNGVSSDGVVTVIWFSATPCLFANHPESENYSQNF